MAAELLDDPLHRILASCGSDVGAEALHEFRVGIEAEKVRAHYSQARIAQANQRLESCRRTVDGIGQHIASIDLFAYMYWNARTHGQGWSDPGFIREFLRDNPGCRVKTPPKATIAVDGFRSTVDAPEIIRSRPEPVPSTILLT